MSKQWLTKPYAILVIAGLALALVISVKLLSPPMKRLEQTSKATEVKTLALTPYAVAPEVIGYGEVKPDTVIDVKAEVSGRVLYVNPDLKEGALVPANTLLISIDKADYELAIKRAQANLVSAQITLNDLEVKQKNLKTDLKLAQQKVELARKDYTRKQTLQKQGNLSKTSLEQAQTQLLQMEQEVQSLKSQLDSLPYQLDLQQSQIDIARSDLETQRRNLERCEIVAPQDFRVSAVNTEVEEYVTIGNSLFVAQGIDRVKINVQLPIREMSWLVRNDANRFSVAELLSSGEDIWKQATKKLGLRADVSLAVNPDTHWQATVARIDSNLDEASRTVGVIVTIDKPYANLIPGVRPPLLEGMYMRVAISANPRPFYVVPSTSLHEGKLYAVSVENTLERIPAKGRYQGDMYLIEAKQLPPTQIITSDIFPAVNGMLLKPVADEKTHNAIQQWIGE